MVPIAPYTDLKNTVLSRKVSYMLNSWGSLPTIRHGEREEAVGINGNKEINRRFFNQMPWSPQLSSWMSVFFFFQKVVNKNGFRHSPIQASGNATRTHLSVGSTLRLARKIRFDDIQFSRQMCVLLDWMFLFTRLYSDSWWKIYHLLVAVPALATLAPWTHPNGAC